LAKVEECESEYVGRTRKAAVAYQASSPFAAAIGHHERVNSSTIPIAIVGSGRVASSLGRLLRDRAAPVVGVASRDLNHARSAAAFIGGVAAIELEAVPGLAQRVLISVSDASITEVALRLAKAGFERGIALHTAGSRGLEALAPLSAAGVSTGMLYPLQTFPTPEQGLRDLPGSYFALTGDPAAMAWAREIVELVSGHIISTQPAQWGLFHAAAVLASNYQVTLIDAALETLEAAGVARAEGLAALSSLARATLNNVLGTGPQAALTGPISRGDVETVRRNREALTAVSPATQDLYRAAGQRTIPIAHRQGLADSAIAQLEKCL
jgi:predicted short-subunit dehydrogenase-like oxidoreductase (DUF2520 family)